ncbi:MAG: peptidase T [Clostridia bacterium]|nr:peptidase T [Clostridia bacterium]
MTAYERLLKYVEYPTASDATNPKCPSSPEQKLLGAALVEEMKALGIEDAVMDDNGYVTGTIPSNIKDRDDIPTIGFIAHMDVVRDVPWTFIKPCYIEEYNGGDILLNEEQDIWLRPADFDSLKEVVGHDLIVTDGTTLLGADDKAGIAEIMTMAERLLKIDPFPHGTVKIGFTPDEEIGRGADLFPVEAFGADFAYTVDGGAFGEIDFETFNAASARVTVNGRSTHPGGAKNKMRNASLLAMEFHGLLPHAERPEHTELREGFYHLTAIKGECEQATLSYILRDHDLALLEQRKEMMQKAAAFMNAKYGEDTIVLELIDSYRNMAEKILPHPEILELARKAIAKLGGTPVSTAVRGGTDGRRLSFMGLPCPNLGTGGRGAHGRFEYVSVDEMEKCTQTLTEIVRLATEK